MTSTLPIFHERVRLLADMQLDLGNHKSFEDGHCAMELVAWLAGQPHSDAPPCACPVISRAVMRLNDRIQNKEARTELLRPILPRIVGSWASSEVMVSRGFVAADMALRVFTPMALEARGHKAAADKLRACAEIVDVETARAGRYAAADSAVAATDAAAYTYAYAAAAAAADAYTYAADADADAADAAAAATDAAARIPAYREAVRMIERMLAVTT